MKTLNIKSAVIALALTLTAQAQARNYELVGPGTSGTFYVTNVGECNYAHGDRRAPARYYTGLYINWKEGKYEPGSDQRVYIWHDYCGEPETSMARALKKKQIFLRLKDSSYSPGHWDLDIENHKTLQDLVANAYPASSPPVSTGPIEFSNEISNGPEQVNLEFIGTLTTYSYRSVLKIDATSRTGQKLIVDVENRQLTFVNSRGVAAFVQQMTGEETSRLQMALRQASPSCPVRISASRSQLKVLKVSNTCVDLGSLPTLNPAG